VAEAPTSLSYAGNDSTLTADGATVTLGPLTVTVGGVDLGSAQAECQLPRDTTNTPAGSTEFGFSDTTYTLTGPQLAALGSYGGLAS
jgi:hypothetical protein